MITQLARYGWQYATAGNRRLTLAMNILVKDEIDIIGDNIKVHAALGIDQFNVMDNGSKDGTRELLAELAKQYDLHIIDQKDQSYQQAKWMTELNWVARSRGADLVFNNDADEFYLPTGCDDYRDCLRHSDSVVTLRRYNMALDDRALTNNFNYWQANQQVNNPILYSSNTQINDVGISMLLVKISPKVITNPHGLFRLKGGNHRAKHIAKLFNKRNENAIEVFHYPIRSFEQFKDNIANRQRLLKQGAKMGDHYRRWVKLYEAGQLEQEFERIVLSQQDLVTLEKVGITKENNTPSEIISSIVETSWH